MTIGQLFDLDAEDCNGGFGNGYSRTEDKSYGEEEPFEPFGARLFEEYLTYVLTDESEAVIDTREEYEEAEVDGDNTEHKLCEGTLREFNKQEEEWDSYEDYREDSHSDICDITEDDISEGFIRGYIVSVLGGECTAVCGFCDDTIEEDRNDRACGGDTDDTERVVVCLIFRECCRNTEAEGEDKGDGYVTCCCTAAIECDRDELTRGEYYEQEDKRIQDGECDFDIDVLNYSEEGKSNAYTDTGTADPDKQSLIDEGHDNAYLFCEDSEGRLCNCCEQAEHESERQYEYHIVVLCERAAYHTTYR